MYRLASGPFLAKVGGPQANPPPPSPQLQASELLHSCTRRQHLNGDRALDRSCYMLPTSVASH